MQKKYALSSFPNSAQIIIISVSTTDVIGKENDKFMLTVPIYISAWEFENSQYYIIDHHTPMNNLQAESNYIKYYVYIT